MSLRSAVENGASLVACDFCGNFVPEDQVHVLRLQVTKPEEFQGSTVRAYACRICYKREQTQTRKYVMRTSKRGSQQKHCLVRVVVGTPLGGSPPFIKQTIRDLRATIQEPGKTPLKTRKLSAHVPEIREEMIQRLLYAIQDAFNRAKEVKEMKADEKTRVWHHQNYYRLVGYLTQVLNGVLEDVDLAELDKRLVKVEDQLAIIETGAG